MTDLLRPEERAALQEAYEAPGAVRAHFPSASQLDGDGQAALQTGFKLWADTVGRTLSALLRVPCHVQPARLRLAVRPPMQPEGVETFPAALAEGEGGALWLCVARPFAATMCERLFGAPLEAREERVLSASERSLLSDVVTEWLASLGSAFRGRRITLAGALTDGDQDEDGADEPWLWQDCALQCGDVSGEVRVALAPETARQLLGGAPPRRDLAIPPALLAEQLGEVPLDLHAVVGRVELTLDDLVNLRAGDVITLDRKAESLVEIWIDERLFFKARAGLAGQSVALEIVFGPEEVESE